MKELYSYIAGEETCHSDDHIKLFDLKGNVWGKLNLATHWQIEAAIENATSTQVDLAKIALADIIAVLNATMDEFCSEENYRTIVQLTGSPYSFISSALNEMKEWCRNGLNDLVDNCFSENSYIRPTAPVLAILPSNSEQVLPYVTCQILLSKNPLIIRSSNRGASSFAANHFAHCFRNAVKAQKRSDIEPLLKAISVIQTGRDYLTQMAIDGWNYVIFGSERTISTFKKDLFDRQTKAKNVISFGTGLSTVVVANDEENLSAAASDTAKSASLNRGTECECSDVVYVKDTNRNRFMESLYTECKKYQDTSTDNDTSIGILQKDNLEYIKHELCTIRNKHLSETENSIGLSIAVMEDHETTMEYPGPVLSVRFYQDHQHLSQLIQKDLDDNDMTRSLKTAIYTDNMDEFNKILPLTRAYAVHHNTPTHYMDFNKPHQGILLLKELSDEVQVVQA